MASHKPSNEKKKRQSSLASQQAWSQAPQYFNSPERHAGPSQGMYDARNLNMLHRDTLQGTMLVRAETFHNHPGHPGQHPFNGPGGYPPRRGTDPNASARDPRNTPVDRFSRIAGLPPRKGHTYGTVKVAKNASATRGNYFYGNNLEAQYLARNHEYGDAELEEGANLFDGDVYGQDPDDFFNEEMDAQHYGDAATGRQGTWDWEDRPIA